MKSKELLVFCDASEKAVKRFYNYVGNRVYRIHSLTTATQWSYLDGKLNPADIGSRGCSSLNMLGKWLEGPNQLASTETQYPVLLPDPEVRNGVVVLKISVETVLSSKFVKFSSWRRLVSALVVFKRAIRRFKAKKSNGEELDLLKTIRSCLYLRQINGNHSVMKSTA